ncbi:hypothetical protein BFJ63_vAg6947 [Fusarium oxysporum f. sp. narcissi]|uniref:Uncharacterized protein n=1 Tax=Fusarium oxysporum f. sp. narcissi TaxID=451672 RepID=A0A4Q2VVI0_FUSOX|nr:hypothetical protein BFJ63_vAg6947 [Fusarium oxysporum f. sp. narcissi]
MDIELESRAATQAVTVPPARNDTAELGPPQTDTDNDGTFSTKTPDQADVRGQGHSGENVIDGNVLLNRLNDRILLYAIRDEVLSRLGYTREVADGNTINGSESRAMRFRFDGISEIAKLAWESGEQIRDAWPASRDVAGVRQYIIEDLGDRNKIQTAWSSVSSSDLEHREIRYAEFEREWLGWRYTARNRRQNKPFGTFGSLYAPLRSSKGKIVILVLTDEDTFPDTYDPDKKFEFGRLWNRYAYIRSRDIAPNEHFLYEICRVFKICMDAWGQTLDIIDELVHVKLDDFDSDARVEDLMFDNSFKRSKDYFVALQLLRIVDEWLDEVQSTVEDMVENPNSTDESMWGRPKASSDVAVRYVNEHATAAQSRVRKKREEINSLRDSLFNATSLRESTKAMALNQAIYVFTVVTVLFTPVSFLATFWALPFLNNPTEGVVPVPSAFRNSFIIMPLLTYALVIVVAWFVGQRNSVNRLLTMLGKLGESTGQLLRSGWNLLRKKPGKGNGRSPYP